MSDPYQDLAAALAPDGIRCQFQTAGQMVVSRQVGPVWPDRGNSFWVTNLADGWYVFTWAPVGYRVPPAADVAALCRACMGARDSAMVRVPAALVEQFGLIELSEAGAEAVYRAMKRGT
jgi:hypothetical protein